MTKKELMHLLKMHDQCVPRLSLGITKVLKLLKESETTEREKEIVNILSGCLGYDTNYIPQRRTS